MTRTLPDFSFETTAQEAAAALKDEIQGKNILITGTTINGIGFEAARAVAPYANLVVITGYNAERLKRSEEALKQEFPSVNVRPLILDLSSLAAVRKAAEEVNAYSEPIHVLVHNAATMGSYYLTEDNLEIQMATAQFGPFLFTKLIAPKLLSARSAGDAAAFVPRVVYVASQAHARTTGINWDKFRLGYADDDVETRISHRLMKRYAEVKTANVLMAQELSRRAKGQLRAYSLHPGLVVTNAVDKGDVLPYYVDIGFLTADRKPNLANPAAHWKTLEQSAATTVVASFDPRLDDKAGAYLVDSTVAKPAAHAVDPANAEKLWVLTEEVVGESLEF